MKTWIAARLCVGHRSGDCGAYGKDGFACWSSVVLNDIQKTFSLPPSTYPLTPSDKNSKEIAELCPLEFDAAR